MEKDKIFNTTVPVNDDFKFNDKVVKVFDDMVNRSVPFYAEIQRMIAELASDSSFPGSSIYDLGCSTGTTLINIDPFIPASVSFVGMDNSQEMLDKCREKLADLASGRAFTLLMADLNKGIQLDNASLAILCLTLQFVRPIYRERLLKNIYSGLLPGGAIILVEKVLAEDSNFNREFIKYYYEMKRRHDYSDIEIAQKREALENILVPYKLSENIDLLKSVGFTCHEVFFKWYNFIGIIAKKGL